MLTDRIFKSKVGWGYHLTLLFLAFTCVVVFINSNKPFEIIILLLVMLLSIHMLLSTWYKITSNGFLIVHCSIFPEKKIKISDISAIEATSMPISAYALSLDRLIVYKEGKQWLLISPENKKEFVNLLKEFNPEITFGNYDKKLFE